MSPVAAAGRLAVIWKADPFSRGAETLDCPATGPDGRPATVAFLIRELAGIRPAAGGATLAYVGGVEVPPEWRARVRVKPGARLVVVAAVEGDVFARLGAVLLAAAATAAAGPLGGVVAANFGLAAGSLGAALVQGGVTAALTAAASIATRVLFPARGFESPSGFDASSANAITGGSNSLRPEGAVPVVIGRHRQFFDLGAAPYTSVRGGEQYAHFLFVAGYDDIEITDLKIGDTPIESFDDVAVDIRRAEIDPRPTGFGRVVAEPALGVTLERGVSHVRTSDQNARRLQVELQAPQGSYWISPKGAEFAFEIAVQVEYRPSSGGAWTTVPGNTAGDPVNQVIHTKDKSLLRRTVGWAVPEGEYEVRVTKTSLDADEATMTAEELAIWQYRTIISEVIWTTLRTFQVDAPIQLGKPVTALSVEIRASDQISGRVDRVSGVSESVGWVFDGVNWVAGKPGNVAEAYVTWLRSSAHDRPISDSEIDWASIEAFHARCAAFGWRYDHIQDYQLSEFETANQILAAGRARVDFSTGKWGVAFDEGDAAPILHRFTPANISDLQSAKGEGAAPHALRVRFFNAEEDWQADEITVYRDGYDAQNATRIEDKQYPGLTYPSAIWHRARYDLRQLELQARVWTFTLNQQFRATAAGERALLSHPAVAGQAGGWVRAVSGATLDLTEEVRIEAGKSYQVEITHVADGSVEVFDVLTGVGWHRSIELSGGVGATVEGDMFAFGEAGAIGRVVVIRSVEPAGEASARVTVFADDLDYLADDPVTPPSFVSTVPQSAALNAAPPKNAAARQYLTPGQRGFVANVELSFEPAGLVQAAEYAGRYRRIDVEDEWTPIQFGRRPVAQLLDLLNATYEAQFRTRGVGYSEFSAWSESLVFTVDGGDQRPLDPAGVTSELVDETTLEIDLEPPADVVRKSYTIRWTPLTTGAAKLDAAILVSDVTSFPVRVRARAGTYFIDAVSHRGVESANSATVSLTAAELKAAAAEQDVAVGDGDPWTGAHSATVVDGGLLRLENTTPGDPATPYEAAGDFTLTDRIDLGGVFRAEISGELDAFGARQSEGVFDRLTWFVDDFFGAVDPAAFSARLAHRTTEDDPAGSPVWTSWAPVAPRIARFRSVEFRVELASDDSDVSPFVRRARGVVNVLPRELSAQNVAVPAGGLSIVYASPFWAVLADPVVTVADAAVGDRLPVLSAISPAGFTVRCVDAGGAGVARTISYRVIGLGGD